MKVNIFEGSRRIVWLTQIIWALGTIIFVWNEDVYLPLTYETYGPKGNFTRLKEYSSCGQYDASEHLDVETLKGTKASINLCFRAQDFSGNIYVPYKTDENDPTKVWGADRHSSQVIGYVESRKRLFYLSQAEEQWINKEARSKRFDQIKNGVIVGVTVLLAIGFFASMIGWIIRGFLGIPQGKDFKNLETKKK